MKIGIDAKWFFSGPPSGSVVVQNLVRQLLLADTEHELHFFLDRRDAGKPFPGGGARVRLHYIWGGNNLLSNLLVLPLSARRLKLDVVVFQNFAPLFSNFRRYSYVHCVLFDSNPEYFTATERLYFAPLKLTARRSHGICTVSHAEKGRMVRYGYGTDQSIDVIYHGVDGRFRAREEHGARELDETREKYRLPERFLLYVGRLNVVKNIGNLLRALPLLRDDIPLVIVGEYDWKMTDLAPLVRELGVERRIVFTGAVYGEELARIYALATVFCFPSYEESFGLPAVEAMASGVPAVLSSRSSLPEIGGEAGSYIDPDRPGEIAAAIDALLHNRALWEQKRALGLLRAQDFRWEYAARDLVRHAVRACGRGGI